MHYDLTDLRLLTAIEEHGSLSRAAAAFPIALSAASNRLRDLEHHFGSALFSRHAGGMRPTPSGRIALDHARRVLAEAKGLEAAMEALAGRQRVTIRMAANTVANSTYLPAALGGFLRDFPDVDLAIAEDSSESVLRLVQGGEVDIGVLDGNLGLDGTVSFPFRQDRLVLLVPLDHPLAGRTSCLFRDVIGHPFIGMPQERAMQRFIEQMAGLLGRPLAVRVRAPGFYAIAQLVAQGAGVAVLPEAAARRHSAAMPAVLVLLNDAWASRELRLCVRDLDGLSAQARQLLSYLTAPDPG